GIKSILFRALKILEGGRSLGIAPHPFGAKCIKECIDEWPWGAQWDRDDNDRKNGWNYFQGCWKTSLEMARRIIDDAR
ncbi:MAG: hypothetical protein JWM99_351, partial [Verrucomicrobiales bacterium]|nr:hypothetical protein [Verrucomicrobiales bacterium]